MPVLLLLTWAGRRGWGWIYLQRGLPRRWLPLGAISFAGCAVIVSVMVLAAGTGAADLMGVAPWLLAFVTLNAVMEELWLRGIFLRPYAAGIGGPAAIVVTALIFALLHMNVTYLDGSERLVFGAGAFLLGVATAWSMRWGRSLWGAVLLHMALDLFVMVDFFV